MKQVLSFAMNLIVFVFSIRQKGKGLELKKMNDSNISREARL